MTKISMLKQTRTSIEKSAKNLICFEEGERNLEKYQ